jgi:hypothetical protein
MVSMAVYFLKIMFNWEYSDRSLPPPGVGTFTGVLACNLFLDKIYIKLRDANNGVGLPEHRLPLAILGGLLLPLCTLLQGWCAMYRLHLAILLTITVLMRLGLFLVIIPTTAYVVDAAGLYSASALTAVIVMRCLAAAFLPLLMKVLDDKVGYGWGFTMLASLTFFLAIIPISIQRHGPQWRMRSEYTKA